MQIALATQTAPSAWWDEDDEVLATVIDELERQAADMKRKGRHRG